MIEYTPTTNTVRRAASDFQAPITPEEFDRWLAAHDAEVRSGVVDEEPEWEYGVVGPTGRMVNNGDYTIQQTHRRRKAGPWVPVKQEGAEQ